MAKTLVKDYPQNNEDDLPLPSLDARADNTNPQSMSWLDTVFHRPKDLTTERNIAPSGATSHGAATSTNLSASWASSTNPIHANTSSKRRITSLTRSTYQEGYSVATPPVIFPRSATDSSLPKTLRSSDETISNEPIQPDITETEIHALEAQDKLEPPSQSRIVTPQTAKRIAYPSIANVSALTKSAVRESERNVIRAWGHAEEESLTEEPFDGDQSTSSRTSFSATNTKKKRNVSVSKPIPRVAKSSKRPGRHLEMQWRLGQAPAAVIREAKENVNYERILSITSRFYRGNADGAWKATLRRNSGEFDGNSLIQSFSVSMVTTAGLISAGQPESAAEVLNNILPLAREVLLSQHPHTFFVLLELSMDPSQTVEGNLRAAVKPYLCSIANATLGAEHPLTILLKTPLTSKQKTRLRIEAQRMAHEEHLKTFGAYSWQTMAQFLFWGRLMARAGYYEDSLHIFERLTEMLTQTYGANSGAAITGLVEQARAMIMKGDFSVKVECLVGDAIRRNDLLSSSQDHEPPSPDAAEARLRGRGLLFSRIAALRVLGRVHLNRRNFGAALYSFQQAMAIAETTSSPDLSVLRLCKADLEATRMMAMEHSMGVLSIQDPNSRLPSMSSITAFPPVER